MTGDTRIRVYRGVRDWKWAVIFCDSVLARGTGRNYATAYKHAAGAKSELIKKYGVTCQKSVDTPTHPVKETFCKKKIIVIN